MAEVILEPLVRLNIYTHFFTIHPNSSRIMGLLFNFLTPYIEKVWAQERGQRPHLVNGKVYAGRKKNNTEFRLHIGQLLKFIELLEKSHIHPEQIHKNYMLGYTPLPYHFRLVDGRVLRDYQDKAVNFAVETTKSFTNSALIAMPTGTGKAQSLDSLVKVPYGWKRMGDIQVGDIVSTPCGKTTKVLGVYPQGIKRLYEVTFEDGRKSKACKEHLWKIYPKGNPAKIMDTELLGFLIRSKELDCYIDLITSPVNGVQNTYSIPEKVGMDLLSVKNQQYLEATLAEKYVRIHEIVGIGIQESGVVLYDSPDYDKAIELQYLVRSIGGIASFKVLEVPNPYYQVTLQLGVKQLKVVSVIEAGDEEAQCIEVEHRNHLYITDDFIVTHNTVTAAGVATVLRVRIAVVVLPKYMEKWGSDLVDNLDIRAKDVMMVTGGKQVKGLISAAQDGLVRTPAIVFSLTTLQGFFDAYEEDSEQCLEDYGCFPQDLWKLLGIGLVISDEAHEHLFSVFRLALFLHGPKFVALSGTMTDRDAFTLMIQDTMFPNIIRFNDIKMEKYIKLFALAYSFMDIRQSRVKTQEFGRTTYSHNAYEASIIKNKPLLDKYIRMIDYVVKLGYIQDYIEGDKLAIYVARIEMATLLTAYLKQTYPHLDVRRYTEKDPYRNVIDADIRIATIGKAGAAIDIPNLRAVIQTIAIDSMKANLQVLGRLRNLKDRDVKFYYLYCESIEKHKTYSQRRVELYQDKVASTKHVRLPHAL